MSGYTKTEKLYKERCGYARYKEFREDFQKLLDKSIGYHVNIEMVPTITVWGRYKQKLDDDIIKFEGGIGEVKGRTIWYWFCRVSKNPENAIAGLEHIIEDELIFQFPSTRKKFDKEIKNKKTKNEEK